MEPGSTPHKSNQEQPSSPTTPSPETHPQAPSEPKKDAAPAGVDIDAIKIVFPADDPQHATTKTDVPTPTPGPMRADRKRWTKLAGLALLALAVLGATNYGTYRYASNHASSVRPAASQPVAAEAVKLTVPQGATIISQCAKKRGTQYVLPKNIPHGPVFNVYKGKVIGVEYMVGRDDLANKKDFLSLPLNGVAFDHMDIGLLSTGHAGYPDPHYHVDLYTVSPEESAAITCET